MLDLSTKLKYYKREDIRQAIVSCAQDREISIKYGDKGFGKRPDVLTYPTDVLELVKRGATSFHCSEERWHRVLDLSPELKRQQLDDNRKAWDLVLDIDCPYWELSKVVTWLFIEALQAHGIHSISVKFSGNKGFHIGVPYEAFPPSFRGQALSVSFPEAPRAIAGYLLDVITKQHITVHNQSITFGKEQASTFTIQQLASITGLPLERLTKRICSSCHRTLKAEQAQVKQTFDFICPRCEHRETSEDNLEEYRKCSKCSSFMEKKLQGKKDQQACQCGSTSSYHTFDPLSIVEVDTVLLASRHMYRMPYSLHEKSGLVSMPIPLNDVLSFEREQANPATYAVGNLTFLSPTGVSTEEGKILLEKAFSFVEAKQQQEALQEETQRYISSLKKEFDKPTSALPEELFPPCITLLLQGVKDGRKRAVFILLNFLKSVGWDYDAIEEKLLAWNEKNPEPLRDVNIKGQLRYHKAQKKDMLPPNCDAKQYYVEIGVCKPDNLCSKIKNPVNYTLRKARYLHMQKKKTDSGKQKAETPAQSQSPSGNKTENDVEKKN